MADLTTYLRRMIDAQRIGGGEATAAFKTVIAEAHTTFSGRKDVCSELGNYLDYAQQILQDVPLNYWKLGEAAGPFVDSGAGAKNLTATAGFTFNVSGPVARAGNAVTLNGAASAAAVASDPLSGLAALTIEGWVNHNSGAWSGSQEMLCNPGLTGHYLAVSAGSAFASMKISTVQRTLTGNAVATSGWHHLVVTWASGGNMKMYQDGILTQQNGPWSGTLDASASNQLLVGAFNAPAPSLFLTGSLAHIAVYSRALSAAEVAAHYSLR